GGATSTVTLNGGTLDLGGHGFNSIVNLNLQSGKLKNLGQISGNVIDLIKTTGGTLTLDGVNAYSGQTLINAGTLAVAATGSITNSTTISVAANSTFDVSAIPGGFSLANKTLTGTGNV